MKTIESLDIESLFTLFEESSLSEFELATEHYEVKMKRTPTAEAAKGTVPAPETKPAEPGEEVEVITSPIVGTFYLTPAPDAPPYVAIGSTVGKGDVLCTIEAMKLMNQLEAEFACQIVRVLAKPEAMVEFGAPLFEVKRL
ncbi:MAG: biotin/lipoyl-containing protein [Sphaerochaeta sp.]|nr:acetyl-CoA carboxylase, biotin carboxyl carrier protein [Sphaerochaeta sp.]MDX9915619.1 biotin/lipoyl-containing protein [Sphaerochaeta sp.]